MRRIPLLIACGLTPLAMLMTAAPAQGTDRFVPSVYGSVGMAEAASSPYDIIYVTADGGETGKLVIDVTNLTIIVDAGKTWTVTAGGGDNRAMDINADGVTVDGLTLKAASNPTGVVLINGASEVKNCTILDDGNECSAYGVDLLDGAILRDCTITFTSGSGRAVLVNGSSGAQPARILGNDINVSLESGPAYNEGIYFFAGTSIDVEDNVVTFSGAESDDGKGLVVGTGHDSTTVKNNLFIGAGDRGMEIRSSYMTIEGNLVEGYNYGLHMLSGSNQTVENNTIVWDSCSSGTYGIWTGIGYSSSASTFANNLIVNAATGMHFTNSVSGYWTISHNAFWSDGAPSCGTGSNRTLTSTQLATNLEPIFCAEHESPVFKYTHRIDSDVAPGNNPWGELIGRWGVECAWGSLTRETTTVSSGTEVWVLEDVTVPADTTLVLEDGVVFRFDDDDESGGGEQGALTELTVHGTLTVGSAVGSEAVLTGTAGSPAKGDWGGVTLDSCSVATITNTDVSGAQIAFLAQDTASVTLSDVTVNNAYYLVAAYDTADVEASEVTGTGLDYGFFMSGSSHLDAENCDLTVSADGVRLFSYLDALDACNITAGSHGLYVGGNGEAEVASTQTTIQGDVAGVFCTSGTATLSGPTIQDSETGIWATGSGDLSMLSGVIEDCDWGAWVDNGGRLTLGQYNGSAAESTQVLVQGCGTNGVGIDSDEDNELEQVRVEGGSDQAWVGIHLLPGSAASVTRCSVAGATGSSAVGILVETEADLLAPKVVEITGNAASGICIDADSTVAVAIDSVTYADSHWRRPKVQDCYYGIDVAATARPVIRATTVDTCRTDVHISPTAVPDLGYNTAGQYGYNVIQRAVSLLAGSRLTRVGGVPDVPAEQNYWGSSTPDGSKISSWVDYLPYLQNQPYAPLSLFDDVSLVAVERPFVGHAYPMPFANRVQIPLYVAAVREPVEVAVFDVQGRWVKTLASGPLASGEHMVSWDGWTGTGERAPSGVYFLKVQVGAKTAAQKLVKTN